MNTGQIWLAAGLLAQIVGMLPGVSGWIFIMGFIWAFAGLLMDIAYRKAARP